MSCYLIKSKLHGLVLDCEGGGKDGAKVIPWDHHGQDNQLWYDDPSTGTIRTLAGHRCLDIQGGELVVNPFKAGATSQQWFRDGAVIRNKTKPSEVLDILDNKKEKGSKVGVWQHSGAPNQCWEFPSAGGPTPPTHDAGGVGRRCYIVSEMHGKVVDIKEGNAAAGTSICADQKNVAPSNNQLWYQDTSGHIKSVLNSMAFTNSAKGQHLVMQNSEDARAQWKLDGNKIVNGLGEVLDILRQNKENGASIISYDYKKQSNQHWRLEFI